MVVCLFKKKSVTLIFVLIEVPHMSDFCIVNRLKKEKKRKINKLEFSQRLAINDYNPPIISQLLT